MNKTPKLLPWLARKAGIPTEKAAALWLEAVSEESLQAGCANDPDYYYRRVVERLQVLSARDMPVAKQGTSVHSPLLVLSGHGNGSAAFLLNPFGMKVA